MMLMRGAVALVSTLVVLSLPAEAEPSFDCAKAETVSEKAVCEIPDLPWFDRQMARLYKQAQAEPGADRAALAEGQRAFLRNREACGADYDCLMDAYHARLTLLAPLVNVHEAYALYERTGEPSGMIWVARFGFDAGVKISTIGGGDHTCTFETDSAVVGGKGVVRWRGKGEDRCRIDIVPNDSDGSMSLQTKDCQEYCGARAVMDGTYTGAP